MYVASIDPRTVSELALVAVLVYLTIAQTRLFLILLGLTALFGAVPAGVLAEIGFNGCCGAPSTGHEGVGYLIGSAMAVLGLVILFVTQRHR